MTMQMLTYQVASILNLTQMKWMKMIATMQNILNQEFQYDKELQYERTY
jgi:hypothetical protein